jgi:hypothetical protein
MACLGLAAAWPLAGFLLQHQRVVQHYLAPALVVVLLALLVDLVQPCCWLRLALAACLAA